jgi:hypothetical protein
MGEEYSGGTEVVASDLFRVECLCHTGIGITDDRGVILPLPKWVKNIQGIKFKVLTDCGWSKETLLSTPLVTSSCTVHFLNTDQPWLVHISSHACTKSASGNHGI